MKICFLTKLYPPSTGGAEMHWHELSNALASRGHKIDVYTQHFPNGDDEFSLHPNVSVSRITKSRQLVSFETLYYSFKAGRHVDFSEYDIVHGSLRPPSTVCVPNKQVTTPLFLTSHGTSLDAFRHSYSTDFKDVLMKYIFHPMNIILDYLASRNADRVIAVSTHTKNQLVSHYRIPEEDITTITPGIDTELFSPVPNSKKFDSSKFNLLYVGRIVPIKGLKLIIDALAKVDTDRVMLHLAGTGRERDTLEAHALSKGLSDNVRFLGHIERNHLPEYYSAADALVLPSRYESLSFVVRESMACGTPVIASDVGGIPTSVEHDVDGLLVERSVKAFAEAISDLVKNPRQLMNLEQNALKKSKEWGWSDVAEDLEALYTDAHEST